MSGLREPNHHDEANALQQPPRSRRAPVMIARAGIATLMLRRFRATLVGRLRHRINGRTGMQIAKRECLAPGMRNTAGSLAQSMTTAGSINRIPIMVG